MKFTYILLLCLSINVLSRHVKRHKEDPPVVNQDWTKVETFASFIGNAVFADKEQVPKCIPKSWKDDGDIRTNKKFKKSIINIEEFFKKIGMFRPFFRKRVNYECHYSDKIFKELNRKFNPTPEQQADDKKDSKSPDGPGPKGSPDTPAPKTNDSKSPGPKDSTPGKEGWISKASNFVKDNANKGLNAANQAGNAIGGAVKDAVNKGVDKAKNLANKGVNAAKGAANKAGGFFGGLKNAFNKGKEALKKGANAIGDKVGDLAKKGLDAVKKGVDKVADSLKKKDGEKKPGKLSEKELKEQLSVADGKIFEFLKNNFEHFKEGILKFFYSPVFNQIIGMMNCLGKLNPNETLKKTIVGLANTMKSLSKKDFVGIAIDFFCQWNHLKPIIDHIKDGLDPKNLNKQWEFFAKAIAKLIEVLKV